MAYTVTLRVIATVLAVLSLGTGAAQHPDDGLSDKMNDHKGWRHPIKKQGYLGSPLVEVTPFVFQGRLYRLENNQKFWDIPGASPGDRFNEDEVRIRDVAKDEIVSVALSNHAFATALVWKGRVYVFAGDYGQDKPWRQITEINMTSSADLKTWTEPVTVVRAQQDEVLFNTAVCRGKDKLILLYETNDSRWPAFTFKYCESEDLVNWRPIPGALYGRDKYVGGPALYYFAPWYYTLYLQALGQGKYETRITRSQDLCSWQDAPKDRPFVTFNPDHHDIPLLDPAARESNASDAELCFFEGKTIIYFTGSNQQVAGNLQWATYDGPPEQLFELFFRQASGTDTIAPAHAGDWLPVLVQQDTPEAAGLPVQLARTARPSARQLKYQQAQLGAFVHFGLASYIGGDMLATPDPNTFNPIELDAEQWVLAAKSFGAQHIVLTTKHHSGFCLWPTATTDYSVKSSPWKNGQGDVVAEFARACLKHDIGLGLYLSAGDKHYGCWSTPQPRGQRTPVGDREAYFKVYMQQVEELLTNYGPVVTLWIDGAYNPFSSDVKDPATGEATGLKYSRAIKERAHALQSDLVIFGDSWPDVRWAGSEQGSAPYPLWNVIAQGQGPACWVSPDVNGWLAAESNIHTRSSWFWIPNNDQTLAGVDKLVHAYVTSIGRGANLLINMTPDTRGLVPDAEVARLAEFGTALKRRFGKPIAQGTASQDDWHGSTLELDLKKPVLLDYAVIEEDIAQGQRIIMYQLEALLEGDWQSVAQGQSVGRKRIELFDPVRTSRLRLRIVKAVDIPIVRLEAGYTAAKKD